jgi:prepilin-type N-terminal cleavage/methylation domain-containing protein
MAPNVDTLRARNRKSMLIRSSSTDAIEKPLFDLRKRGFTLTEIAIGLSIIGLVLAAIWSAASTVYEKAKVAETQRGVLMAAQAVRSMFATSLKNGVVSGPQGAVNVAFLTAPGMFPPSWTSNSVCSNGPVCYENPWFVNSSFNSAFVVGFSAPASQFEIVLNGVPDDGCTALLDYFSADASSANGGPIAGLAGNSVVQHVLEGGVVATLPSMTFITTGAAACVGGPASSGYPGGNEVFILFDMTQM